MPRRYSAYWEFWDKAKASSSAFADFERELEVERGGFAESTLEATRWLKKYHPNRLNRWWKLHPGLKEHLEVQASGQHVEKRD